MDRFIYITPEQARITHEKTIQYSGGGTLEELDFGKLESVLYNIQNGSVKKFVSLEENDSFLVRITI